MRPLPRKLVVIMPLLLCLIALADLAPLAAEGAGTDKEDVLCANAPQGSVEKLPEIIARWVVVLCTPTGHALAPNIEDKPIVWIAQTDGRPFMLQAAPSNWHRPPSLSKYDMRFT